MRKPDHPYFGSHLGRKCPLCRRAKLEPFQPKVGRMRWVCPRCGFVRAFGSASSHQKQTTM